MDVIVARTRKGSKPPGWESYWGNYLRRQEEAAKFVFEDDEEAYQEYLYFLRDLEREDDAG